MPIDFTVTPPRTPGGCRADRGRGPGPGIRAPDGTSADVTFPDGSVYRFFKVSDAELEEWNDREDPGCFFNHSFSRGTGHTRLRPPD